MSDVLTANPDHSRSDLSASWIKANVLGALVIVAGRLGASVLGTAMTPDAAAAMRLSLSVATVATVLFGFVLLAFLTGGVLRQKLPAFQMRYWLTLYAVVGVISALGTAFGAADEPLRQQITLDYPLIAIIGAMIACAAAGAVVGAVQALVLRHAARGLRQWIAFSALAGMTWIILSLASAYGPQAGIAREIASEAALFTITAISSVIMLPALHRLRPR